MSTRMFASFRLAESELAVPGELLQEVVNYPDKVTQVPLAPEFLLGLFDLRGVVTPIVDMRKLLGFPEAAGVKKVAIVLVEGLRVGLVFDATSEIIHISPSDYSAVQSQEARHSVIRGVLRLQGGGRFVEVLDPGLLLKIENLPQIFSQGGGEEEKTAKKFSKRSQCITVKLGDLELGLRISAIREIIRVPEIKRSVLAVDHCVGLVNLRGMIIPILNFRSFLNISSATESGRPADQRIVIFKMQQIQVGFLVDSVNSIVPFYEEDVLPIPLFQQERIEMMQGLVAQSEQNHVILLNEDKILTDGEVQALSHGHEKLYGSHLEKGGQVIKSERRTYLSFRLGYSLSTRLNDVDEIAKVPEELLCPPGAPSYVMGVMTMRGEAVTVIDLRKYYNLNMADDGSEKKILIVKGAAGRLGLLVDSVESIDTVDESKKIKIPDFLAADISKALRGDMKEILEMLDLAGKKKTYMLLDIPGLLQRLEVGAAVS